MKKIICLAILSVAVLALCCSCGKKKPATDVESEQASYVQGTDGIDAGNAESTAQEIDFDTGSIISSASESSGQAASDSFGEAGSSAASSTTESAASSSDAAASDTAASSASSETAGSNSAATSGSSGDTMSGWEPLT